MRYEIDTDNAVKIFYPDSDVASIYQPHWPNGESWIDAAEASSWAELYIASVVDESAPYAPNARGEQGRAKPTAEQKAVIEAAYQALESAKTLEERQLARQALQSAYEALN